MVLHANYMPGRETLTLRAMRFALFSPRHMIYITTPWGWGISPIVVTVIVVGMMYNIHRSGGEYDILSVSLYPRGVLALSGGLGLKFFFGGNSYSIRGISTRNRKHRRWENFTRHVLRSGPYGFLVPSSCA